MQGRLQKRFAAVLVFASILLGSQMIANRALSQVSITSGATVTQNFDGMGSTTTLPSGFRIGATYSTGSGTVGQVGGTTGTGVLNSSSPGGIYNFANGIAASATDRAIGVLSSGSVSSPQSISAQIQNNTGSVITQLDITFDYEKYRSGTRAWDWSVGSGTDGITYTTIAAGAQNYPSDANNTTVFNPPTTISKSFSLTGLSIANGAFYYIRWQLTGSGGTSNGQGLAIDNFTVTAIPPCVAPAVTIATDPASVSVPISSSTSFTVSGVTDAASYQWQRNTSGTSGGTWADITSATMDPTGTYSGYTTTSTATSNTLSLSNVPASWNGYGYRCVVTNCTGSVTSAAALLTVTAAPCSGTPTAGTATPSVASFCNSGSTTLTLIGGSSGSGLTYQWSSSATNVAPGTNISGATSITYNTPTLTATTYYWVTSTCATSSLSTISAVGVVTINALPAISATPAGGNVCSGGSGLSMTASGAATYVWSPATGLSATTGATVIANPTANTTYTITGTSAAGCVGSTTVPVTFSLNPGTLSVSPSATATCPGVPQLLTATGGLVGPTTVNTGSITIPATIAANGTIATDLTMAGVPAGATITGASVNVISFGSQFQDDYVINVKAPNGKILNLINARGTHTSAVTTLYSNTILSSASATSLATGSGTYTGTWAADMLSGVGGPLYTANTTLWSDLYGTPNGTWTLSIYNTTTFANTVVPSEQWSLTLNYSYATPITWTPATGLYSNPAGTTAYVPGTATTTVYVNPAAAGVTTYSATATNVTCATIATAVVTANPLPASITGAAQVCVGLTTTLATTSTTGTWSSGSTGIATIDAATGVVTGVVSGTSIVTYTLPTGCITTRVVTVNPLPAAIAGAATVCANFTTTYTDTDPLGTWTSSLATIATVSSAGLVTGVAPGSAVITYTLPTGCIATKVITVNTTPAAITGTAAVCIGLTTALSETTTGGNWSSAASGTASVDATGLVTGAAAGNVNISYTLPTGCYAIRVVTVNVNPNAITGTATVCQGLTTALSSTSTGGTWSSNAPGTASVDAAGVVTGNLAGTTTITYTLPTGCINLRAVTVNPIPVAITGNLNVCQGTTSALSNATPGGAWTSSASGIAPVSATGVVTGSTPGTATISYSLSLGCMATAVVTVQPAAATITGASAVCAGSTITLSNTGIGTWSSSNTNADVDVASGVVTGLSAGTSVITFTLATTCFATKVVSVNPLPNPILGSDGVCVASTTTLTDVGGGTWTSSNSNATVGLTTGIVTGVATGASIITYTLPTGCYRLKGMTISPLPLPVTGPSTVCAGGFTITMSDATPGGTWSIANPNAAIDAATGVFTAYNASAVTVSYTIAAGCSATKVVTINALPFAIVGDPTICMGSARTLLDPTPGGTWTSSSTNAAVGFSSGVVTGITAGTADITYRITATGCYTIRIVTVAAVPAAITGPTNVCVGSSIDLSNATAGGTWTRTTGNVTIGSISGTVTGLVAGTDTIHYNMPEGCFSTKVIIVNPLPTVYTVTGTGTYCSGIAGRAVGLTGSTAGVVYQLFSGSTAIGTPVSGTGGAISFGLLPAGTYSVAAQYPGTLCASNMNGTAVISAITSVIPSITVATNTLRDTNCGAFPMIFTATTLNGGTAPIYHWSVNGTPVTAAAGVYSYVPTNGDVVKVVVNSNAVCAMPDSAVSIHTIAVFPEVMPHVAVFATPGNNVCAGTMVNFTPIPVNGGSAPSFNWSVNGVVTSTGALLAYAPANGDVVSVRMNSNAVCRLADFAVSPGYPMTVAPAVTPIVNITAFPGTLVDPDDDVTFTATVIGATAVTYQWSINGTPIPAATSATYSGTAFENGSVVSCKVTTADACALSGSNSVTMRLTTGFGNVATTTAAIDVFPNPNNGTFIISGTTGLADNQDIPVIITDMAGRTVYTGMITARNGAINEQLSLGNTLANGMYLLRLHTAQDNVTIHLSISK